MSQITASQVDIEFVHQPASGPRKNMSMLFVPGLYHGAWAFSDGLMPFFAKKGFDVYSYSPRGHGKSAGRDLVANARFDDFLADLCQAASRISGPLVLVGHSMGGMLVERYLEFNEAAGAILLCGPSGQDLKDTSFTVLENFFWPTLKFVLTGNPDHLYHDRRSCRGLLFGGEHSENVDKALDHICSQPQSRKVMKDLMVFKAGPAKAACPTLLIGAEADISIPEGSLENRAKNRWYDCKMYEGRPHEIFITQGWEEVAEDMGHWLNAKFGKKSSTKAA